MIDWLHWFNGCIDWLIDWLIGLDWLIALIDWLIDWLDWIDWLHCIALIECIDWTSGLTFSVCCDDQCERLQSGNMIDWLIDCIDWWMYIDWLIALIDWIDWITTNVQNTVFAVSVSIFIFASLIRFIFIQLELKYFRWRRWAKAACWLATGECQMSHGHKNGE